MKTPYVVEALGALAHEHRLAIYRLLVQRGPEGLSAGIIGQRIGLLPSSLTFHLQNLQRAGLIAQRRESRQLIYSVDFSVMNGLVGYLTENCCGKQRQRLRGELRAGSRREGHQTCGQSRLKSRPCEPLMIRGRPPRSTAAALLESQGLPISDITDEHLEHFFFVGSDGSPTGLVGLELYGGDALLRSLASVRTRGATVWDQPSLNTRSNTQQRRVSSPSTF